VVNRASQVDGIARELAQGELTRRQAVGRLGGAFLGTVLFGTSSPASQAAVTERNCPPGRKACGGKCCPKGAKCKHGKCRCGKGRNRCGKQCVNLQGDSRHCGSCGHACGPGETCFEGNCTSSQPGSTCSDGIKNGAETDVDCGGPDCPPCATGKACQSASDCASGMCSGGVCVVKTCADYPGQCGTLSNGCGGSIVCNTCTVGQTCNAGVCCNLKTCADYPGGCGTLSNGCGGSIVCNTCTGAQTCNAGVCCTLKTCAVDHPGKCGTFPNGCGGTLTCLCGGSQTCSGGNCI
jgi:hypothetical protein